MADLTKAALLSRLSFRMHELEMDRIKRKVSARDYREVKANLARQIEAVQQMAG